MSNMSKMIRSFLCRYAVYDLRHDIAAAHTKHQLNIVLEKKQHQHRSITQELGRLACKKEMRLKNM